MKFDKIILASKSPRRLEILRKHGIEPIVRPADISEEVGDYDDITEVPRAIATKKASYVLNDALENHESSGIIIAADTIVYLPFEALPSLGTSNADAFTAIKAGPAKGIIMGKPESPSDGFEMLKALSGKTHLVITGVCIADIKASKTHSFSETTEVTFEELDDEMLKEYLATDEPYDKAGAYAIQGTLGKYVKEIHGDYENVVGLPWERIEREMEDLSK